jgi:hypothetical protein
MEQNLLEFSAASQDRELIETLQGGVIALKILSGTV